MSHGGSGHDSCSILEPVRCFNSKERRVARGVTDHAVGSGALLGGSSVRLAAIKVRTDSGEANADEQHRVRLTIQVVDSSQAKLFEPRTPLRTFERPR